MTYNESALRVEMVQLLDEEGNGLDESVENVPEEQLHSFYEWMLRSRIFDERLLKMQRQGRIGTYAPYSGQEAAQIGSVFALDKKDWIFPSYRELAACVAHGMPMKQALLYVRGHLDGGKSPEDLNIFPIQIIIAAQALHAAGCAWAEKLKGGNGVAVAYFGDGATSEGDFHEALNIASVHKVPAVFFCQNNQWAISVPLKQQTASKTIAQKAVAYGMTGVQVDGNDVLAVNRVMQEAVDRARNGEGPTLIEAVTYRQGPHTTSDDPTKYRNQQEAQEWISTKDPLLRLERLLRNKDLLTDERKESLTREIHQEIDKAVEEAEQTALAPTPHAFDHVYEEKHKLLKEQQDEVTKRMTAAKEGSK